MTDDDKRVYPGAGLEEKNEKIPVWMLILYGGLAAWFLYYLYTYFY